MISFNKYYSSFKKIFALIIIASLFITYGCHSKKAEPDGSIHLDFTPAPDSGIRFDFTATGYSFPDPKIRSVVEIEAQLINDKADTVYFLSTACDGEQYCLVYDEIKLAVWPINHCDSNKIVKVAILPMGVHKFRTRFKCFQGTDWIDIGFKFWKVDRNFDTDVKSFDSFIREIKVAPIVGPVKRLVHKREMYY